MKFRFTVATMLAATAWAAVSCTGLAMLARIANINELPPAERLMAVLRAGGSLLVFAIGLYLAIETLLGQSRQAYKRLLRIAMMLATALAIVFFAQAISGMAAWLAANWS